jgi:hypothetical protein
MPQQPSNSVSGWTPVDESTAPSGWTPVDDPGKQPSAWDVLTQPTEKTDQEYLSYRGPAGVAGATVKGLDDVGRGVLGALSGAWNTVRHPIDTAKGIADLPSQAAQVPGAIKDINASPDPLGTYANAAQDTASQGAGQALVALGTEGVGRAASKAAPYVGPVSKALVKGYVKKVIPPEVGQAVKAVKATNEVKRGAIANAFNPATSEARTLPGQNPPEVIAPPTPKTAAPIPRRSGLALPPAPKGAELSDLPATGAQPAAQTGEALGQVKRGSIAAAFKDPGAPYPETPPKQVMQGSSLLYGPKPIEDPAAGLGSIPVKRGAVAEQMQPPQPQPIQRGSLRQMVDNIGNKVGEELKASPPPNPKQPIYQRGSLSQSMEGATDVPEGHTPHQSSAMRSSMYDSGAKEFHARMTSGDTTYVYGDVAPEEAEAFNSAESKGKAYQQMKSGHPLVAKIVNGKRVAVKP